MQSARKRITAKGAHTECYACLWHAASPSIEDPDPDPEGSETVGRIQIQSGSEISILDTDSNSDPKPDPIQICKLEPYI